MYYLTHYHLRPKLAQGMILKHYRVFTLACQASAFSSVARRFINDLDSLMVNLDSQP